MFFSIQNKHHISAEQLKTRTLMSAYFIIKNYPMHATELILEQFLQQEYKMSLKNLCINLLLNISYYEDDEKNLVLIFKDQKYDKLARLITYGNGAIPGSKILQRALNN